MLRGITAQLRADRRLIEGCYGIQVKGTPPVGEPADEDVAAEGQLFGPAQGYSGKYKDDLTGQPLRDDLVKAARCKWTKVILVGAMSCVGHLAAALELLRRSERTDDEKEQVEWVSSSSPRLPSFLPPATPSHSPIDVCNAPQPLHLSRRSTASATTATTARCASSPASCSGQQRAPTR